MVKKRQNRRQEKTKQDQYDTAAYVFTFVRIPSGTTFRSETPVLARIQRPERTGRVARQEAISRFAGMASNEEAKPMPTTTGRRRSRVRSNFGG